MFENNTECKMNTKYKPTSINIQQDRGIHYHKNNFKYSCKQRSAGYKQNVRTVLSRKRWYDLATSTGEKGAFEFYKSYIRI